MKTIILYILLMNSANLLHAQILHPAFDLISYSKKQGETFSFAGNPASLGRCLKWSAAVYSERPYLLNELSAYKGVVALPFASGGLILSGGYAGQANYNEVSFGLGYGRRMGKLDAGLRFDFSRLSAGHYGKASSVQAGGGIIYHVNEQFRTGIHIVNPFGGSLYKKEKLPYHYMAALGYDASEQFFIGASIRKTEDLPVSFDIGLQYAFDEKLRVRAGFRTEGSEFYCGGGFKLENLAFDAILTMHSQLGLSPALAVSFYPKEK